MRRFWKKGAVLSLKLDEGIYTLAQMVDDERMMTFFNIFRDKDEWQGIDLNSEQKIFTVETVNVVKGLGVRRIKDKEVTPLTNMDFFQNNTYIQPYMNTPEGIANGGVHIKGGKLKHYVNGDVKYLKENLDIHKDRDAILTSEFSTIITPNLARQRLLFCYKFNEDFCWFKHKCFEGVYSDDLVTKYEKLTEKFDIKF